MKLNEQCGKRVAEQSRPVCEQVAAKNVHRLAQLIQQNSVEQSCEQFKLCGKYDRKLNSAVLCDAARALYEHAVSHILHYRKRFSTTTLSNCTMGWKEWVKIVQNTLILKCNGLLHKKFIVLNFIIPLAISHYFNCIINCNATQIKEYANELRTEKRSLRKQTIFASH